MGLFSEINKLYACAAFLKMHTGPKGNKISCHLKWIGAFRGKPLLSVDDFSLKENKRVLGIKPQLARFEITCNE